MNYGYMVIYQKENGDLLYRASKTKPHYLKGDNTSMGWKVVDIQRLYNGKIYSYFEYDNLLRRKFKIRNILSYIDKINISKVLTISFFIYIFLAKGII